MPIRRRAALVALPALALAACERTPTAPPSDQGGFVGPSAQRGHQLRQSTAFPSPQRQIRTQVAVVGGGIAGLAAARELAKTGIDFALIELENTPGGNARSHAMASSAGPLACPLGAHYLPVPGSNAPQVQQLLVDLGLAETRLGRFALNAQGERHMAHSPQERCWFEGEWHAGLWPADAASPTARAQFQAFSSRVDQLAATGNWRLPILGGNFGRKPPLAHAFIEFDAITFDAWLNQEGFTEPLLRTYLNYCCTDDYGAGSGVVSAWAGLHYFASRHGLGAADKDANQVLTWPQGNGWLVARMAQPLADRIHTGWLVHRVAEAKRGVEVDAVDANGQPCRWLAEQAIVCLPLNVADRVVQPASARLKAASTAMPRSAWVVCNALLSEPLEVAHTAGGAPTATATAWDNIVFGSASLGYVNASHQHLSASPKPHGPRVITHYTALGAGAAAAQTARDMPWTHWRDRMLADLQQAHPDLPRKLERTEVAAYGHAMAVPVPGVAQSALGTGALAQLAQHGVSPRIALAHSDLAGYSVFEEAFTAGLMAGALAAKRAGRAATA